MEYITQILFKSLNILKYATLFPDRRNKGVWFRTTLVTRVENQIRFLKTRHDYSRLQVKIERSLSYTRWQIDDLELELEEDDIASTSELGYL